MRDPFVRGLVSLKGAFPVLISCSATRQSRTRVHIDGFPPIAAASIAIMYPKRHEFCDDRGGGGEVAAFCNSFKKGAGLHHLAPPFSQRFS